MSLSSSLLVRVKARDAAAWERFVALYGPLVYRWCRRCRLQPADAMETVQEVFRAVAGAIEDFRRDQAGDTFQGWLRTITRNKVRDFLRVRRPLAVGGTEAQVRMASVQDMVLDDQPEPEHEHTAVIHRGLELVRAEFADNTWQAFWQTTVDSHSPAEVAARLQMSVVAVYKAKSRVLMRLREELKDLVD